MRISTVAEEGVMQVARYRHLRLLLSVDEMDELMRACQPFSIFEAGRPHITGEISRAAFLESYAKDVEGERFESCSIWTADPDALYAIALPDGRQLIRPIRPVVQVRPGESFQLSYPHLYQDPKTQVIGKVDHSAPNSLLFKKLQRWVRRATFPIG